MVPKGFKEKLEELEIGGGIKTTVLLINKNTENSPGDLRKLCHSDSNKKQQLALGRKSHNE